MAISTHFSPTTTPTAAAVGNEQKINRLSDKLEQVKILQIIDRIKRDSDYQLRAEDLNLSELSTEGQNAVYEAAFTERHPYITRQSEEPNPSSYAIGLLWINQDPPQSAPKKAARTIYGPLGGKKAKTTLRGWAKRHRGSKIYIFFDGALVTDKQIERSRNLIRKEKQYVLVDIRTIVPNEKSAIHFFHPSMPVYFRVDLARLFAFCYGLERHETFVITDWDIKPMTPKELLDDRSRKILKLYGAVFASLGPNNLENGFSMLTNSCVVVRALEEAICCAMNDNVGDTPALIQANTIYPLYETCLVQRIFGSTDKYYHEKAFKHLDGPISELMVDPIEDGDPKNDPFNPSSRHELARLYQKTGEITNIFVQKADVTKVKEERTNLDLSTPLLRTRLFLSALQRFQRPTRRVELLQDWTPPKKYSQD